MKMKLISQLYLTNVKTKGWAPDDLNKKLDQNTDFQMKGGISMHINRLFFRVVLPLSVVFKKKIVKLLEGHFFYYDLHLHLKYIFRKNH